jgi:hypothetical protein
MEPTLAFQRPKDQRAQPSRQRKALLGNLPQRNTATMRIKKCTAGKKIISSAVPI